MSFQKHFDLIKSIYNIEPSFEYCNGFVVGTCTYDNTKFSSRFNFADEFVDLDYPGQDIAIILTNKLNFEISKYITSK
jgi:hypothetical protein